MLFYFDDNNHDFAMAFCDFGDVGCDMEAKVMLFEVIMVMRVVKIVIW